MAALMSRSREGSEVASECPSPNGRINMSHLGILTFPGTGHLNPMCALGRRLKQRGHQVTIFQIADLEAAVQAAGLNFVQIGRNEFPLGALRLLDHKLSRLNGLEALRYTGERIVATSTMVLEDAPEVIHGANIDALLVDQAEVAGGTVAEHLELPFISVALAVPIHLEANVPFFAFNWRYGSSLLHKTRNHLGNLFIEHLAGKSRLVLNPYRERWHLPQIQHTNDLYSRRAQIAQIPGEFDFPRRKLPDCFHYTGPFIDSHARKPVDFPWDRLATDRPLIYATMGTLQNGVAHVFQVIAEACAGLDAQLVLSLGAGFENVTALPGKPIVVRYAPQLELLRHSALTICHGGLNTVLESLSAGIPMVVIPVTNDQPGVGSRVEWTGTGKSIPVQRLATTKLRDAVRCVLEDPNYCARARYFQACMANANGLEKAADIVEKSLGLYTEARGDHCTEDRKDHRGDGLIENGRLMQRPTAYVAATRLLTEGRRDNCAGGHKDHEVLSTSPSRLKSPPVIIATSVKRFCGLLSWSRNYRGASSHTKDTKVTKARIASLSAFVPLCDTPLTSLPRLVPEFRKRFD
jgi:zeaxanthin glucosyltransferase